ncbi:MAG: DJ-1/PfpI family protein [Pseudomonadota bacterium]
MNIGIYIYDQAEVLDFSGPFEVFSTASRIFEHGDPFNVFMVSERGGQIEARGGYEVCAKYGFADHPPIDVLVVVGGVHTDEMEKSNVISWIAEQADAASLVASVCTGAFLLAQAKVIDTHKVTTHWQDIDELKVLFPELNVVEGVRWVDQGDLITSGGISAGIDMSLHMVSRLQDEELAVRTAKQMEFVWTKNS